ncbi:TPA: hypothetical protein RTF97_001387 [Campylobacter jejuni]|nr:hypothetical protein [Campylobacter jejuni]EHM5772872.1 hypothetical protein [Campylobacter jejuni]EIK5212804.1 hypothetical protein [Campylobacter jejuni]MCG4134252.1 hypothetical protein [Campylobacter jejuni]MCW1692074.1 hypothetical protein [Campylobacter jejuni]
MDPKDIINKLKNIKIEQIQYNKINTKSDFILKDFLQNFHNTIDENFK